MTRTTYLVALGATTGFILGAALGGYLADQRALRFASALLVQCEVEETPVRLCADRLRAKNLFER